MSDRNTIKKEDFPADFERAISSPAFQKGGYVIAQLTNKLCIEKISENQLNTEEIAQYGLDIRMFNEGGEIRWSRSGIGEKAFIRRERLDDIEMAEGFDYWDEEQYLDIDTKKSKSPYAVATGGGRYFLPLEKYMDAKVKIRNYLSEEDTGRVYISDWRVVDFIEGSPAK